MNILSKYFIPKEAPPLSIPREDLKKINAETLLILGERDPLVGNTSIAIEYTSVIDNITVHTLDTGHTLWIEEPEKTNLLIDEFLNP